MHYTTTRGELPRRNALKVTVHGTSRKKEVSFNVSIREGQLLFSICLYVRTLEGKNLSPYTILSMSISLCYICDEVICPYSFC